MEKSLLSVTTLRTIVHHHQKLTGVCNMRQTSNWLQAMKEDASHMTLAAFVEKWGWSHEQTWNDMQNELLESRG